MGNQQSEQLGGYRIQIQTATQLNDGSGLFDGDAKLQWEDHQPQEGLFVRDQKTVLFLQNGNKRTHSQQEKIASLTFQDKFRIHNVGCDGGLWHIIQKGYKMQLNDVIKFGRFRIRVTVLNQETLEDQNSYQSFQGLCVSCEKPGQVISPCNCKVGNLSKIHTECFNKWFQKRYQPQEFLKGQFYCWKKLECEQCKKQLSYIFLVDNIRYSFIKLVDSQICLELITKDSQQMKGLYVVYGDVKIGRQQGIQVKLSDASVSREHAFLKLHNGQFYLNDNSSKFGTMVYIPEQFEIVDGDHIFQAVQTRIRIKINTRSQSQISQLSTLQE